MLIPVVAFAPGSPEFVDSAGHLAIAGPIFVNLPTTHQSAENIAILKQLLRKYPCHVGRFSAVDIEFATTVLDSGALTVAFSLDIENKHEKEVAEAIADLAEAISSLPASRIQVIIRGASASVASVSAAISALRSVTGGFILTTATLNVPSDDIKLYKAAAGRCALAVVLEHNACVVKASDVGRLHKHQLNVLNTAAIATTSEEIELGEGSGVLDVGSCVVACARSDRPDGLYTTVVSDECAKTLGLVYSSGESILVAIRSRRGVYYSRSRGGLWRKGDTSGCWQQLLSLRLDCDSDALLFTIRQMGDIPAFCHLETRTCWGEDSGLTALHRTLAARLVDAPAGSYTKRLFDDPTLLKHKLLEEAQELSEAVEPDHVAAEAADVMYFALVACAKAGVTLADVEAHLDRRALKVRRRAGDSKPARIAAAAAHFEAMRAASAKAEAT